NLILARPVLFPTIVTQTEPNGGTSHVIVSTASSTRFCCRSLPLWKETIDVSDEVPVTFNGHFVSLNNWPEKAAFKRHSQRFVSGTHRSNGGPFTRPTTRI